jgi:hypothetical protein
MTVIKWVDIIEKRKEIKRRIIKKLKRVKRVKKRQKE